jgi:hypothetical protein
MAQPRQARIEDRDAFESPGLYLWGVKKRPLYIGITRASFGRRFNRYIWSKRSQCNLAQEFEAALISKGIAGFPIEILEYAQQSLGSNVRLQGACRFAQEGIAKVWFALFPHLIVAEIEHLERALIPLASKWNESKNFGPLLNKAFNG